MEAPKSSPNSAPMTTALRVNSAGDGVAGTYGSNAAGEVDTACLGLNPRRAWPWTRILACRFATIWRALVKQQNKAGARSPKSRQTADQVSELTTNRLSVYLRCLTELEAQGARTVSSQSLAEQFHLNAAQIRKDLAYFGEFGVRGVGYYVSDLKRHLRQILGLDRTSGGDLRCRQPGPRAGRLPRVPAGRLRDCRDVRQPREKIGQQSRWCPDPRYRRAARSSSSATG